MKALDFLKCMRKDIPYEWTELDEAIAELEEAIKPKTCEGCKWEQETNLITTKVGDKVDICTLCIRYEKQDNYEKKDNA